MSEELAGRNLISDLKTTHLLLPQDSREDPGRLLQCICKVTFVHALQQGTLDGRVGQGNLSFTGARELGSRQVEGLVQSNSLCSLSFCLFWQVTIVRGK